MKYFLVSIALLICSMGSAQTLPQMSSDDNQIIRHNGFVVSFNETYEQANWVYYVLKPSDLVGDTKAEREDVFKADTHIPTGSATLDDYKKSGYDRGHLKPAGDEPLDQEQQDETFVMSNISPQEPSFNRGIWLKLENYVRTVAIESDSVIVITGGVLTPDLKTIGINKVAVPKFFYKYIMIYKSDKVKVQAFIIPNKKSDEALSRYLVDLDMFVKFTHLSLQ